MTRIKSLGFSPTGVLDVGAYRGNWSHLARQVFPDPHILMIDALPENAAPLARVVEVLGDAEHRTALLGAERSPGRRFYRTGLGGHLTGSSLYQENTNLPSEAIALDGVPLDDVVASCRHQTYELLKIDVQGAEIEVLKGAGTVLRDVEFIILEVAVLPYNQQAPSFADVIAHMASIGFVAFEFLDEVRFRKFGNRLFQIDILFCRTDSRYRPTPPFQLI